LKRDTTTRAKLEASVTVLLSYDPQGLESVRSTLTLLTSSPTVLLYVGPDQIMPLTSVLGAIVGVVLMFWNRLVALFGRGSAKLTRRESSPAAPQSTETPSGEPQP
jgi:hypothetical protein